MRYGAATAIKADEERTLLLLLPRSCTHHFATCVCGCCCCYKNRDLVGKYIKRRMRRFLLLRIVFTFVRFLLIFCFLSLFMLCYYVFVQMVVYYSFLFINNKQRNEISKTFDLFLFLVSIHQWHKSTLSKQQQ